MDPKDQPISGDDKKLEDVTQSNPSTSSTEKAQSNIALPSTVAENVNDDGKKNFPDGNGGEVDGGDSSEDEILTLADVVNEEDELESDAEAVLGNADDCFCSYKMGAVKRQALYACNTCEMNVDPETGEKYLAGFCLACSYDCHDGHEIFELYTKRNFTCDCGNDKFANNPCTLTEKKGFNKKNKYNHNFLGLYCTCKRPYPDPDIPMNECSMIQCVICEDWFHDRHLLNYTNANFKEMVCYLCVEKLDFLVYYEEENLFDHEDPSPIRVSLDDSGVLESSDNESSDSSNEASSTAVINEACKLEQIIENYKLKYNSTVIEPRMIKTLYLGSTWRGVLCKCVACKKKYRELKVGFITNKYDRFAHYKLEDYGSNLRDPRLGEKFLIAALKKLNRVQQIEYIRGFQNFRDDLSNYLEQFRGTDHVVTAEDINKFFEELKQRKRPRFTIPYKCSD